MKILIVNKTDKEGGAARAAYRLHQALTSMDISSQMLVQNKVINDLNIIGPTGKIKKIFSKIRPTIDSIPLKFYPNKDKTYFSISWFPFSNIIDQINAINPDIVHLHWISGGMFRLEEIKRIKAPIMWTLHDNMAFTGGCHIMWDCEKYLSSCEYCPRLNSNSKKDLSYFGWNRKKRIYDSIDNLIIVGLSNWITECSVNSTLLKSKKHFTLPNPIDTNIFKPISKQEARKLWNLPKDQKIVLFGASNATSDINKGFKELYNSILKLKDNNVELVIFGGNKPEQNIDFGYRTHYVGILSDDISLVALYNCADVVVVPSLQENLSNTIMESMSCGTAVVAFDTCGNNDLIKHKGNGYLARKYSSADMATGIEWILKNNKSKECRDFICTNFDYKVVAKKYINLYKKVLNDSNKFI